MIDADGFAAGVAVLGEDGVETVEAVGTGVARDVALAAQHAVALETGEVAHVPRPALGLGALVGQNQLLNNNNNNNNIQDVSRPIHPRVPKLQPEGGNRWKRRRKKRRWASNSIYGKVKVRLGLVWFG